MTIPGAPLRHPAPYIHCMRSASVLEINMKENATYEVVARNLEKYSRVKPYNIYKEINVVITTFNFSVMLMNFYCHI